MADLKELEQALNTYIRPLTFSILETHGELLTIGCLWVQDFGYIEISIRI